MDFDEFDETSAPISDAGEQPDSDSDAGGDTDDDPQDGGDEDDGTDPEDVGPGEDPLTIGASCSVDADCGQGGLCRQNYCTTDCSVDADCGEGSACHQITRGPNAGEALCLSGCAHGDDAACGGLAERDDLGCLPVNQLPSAPFVPDSQSACLPDQDGDQVADMLDNCPDTANPDQLDFDADGIGNACDSAPTCHDLAVEGVLDYGTVDYPAANFSFPDTTHHDWLPVYGGTDEENNQVKTLHILDRRTGTWKSAPDLPFAAFDRLAVASARGEYGLTPGTTERLGEAYKQPLFLGRDGSTRRAPQATFNLEFTTAASTSDNQLFIHGYTKSSDPSIRTWYTSRLNLEEPRRQAVTIFNSEVVDWHSTQLLTGGVLFYSDVAVGSDTMLLNFSDPFGLGFLTKTIAISPQDTVEVAPFVIPAGGQYIYIMDRNNGMMSRYGLDSGALQRVAGLDLDLSEMVDPAFVSTPQSMSFIALDRPSAESTELRAREYFLGCMPEYSVDTPGHDSDGDGINDFVDNCPLFANYGQSDLDGDRMGDSCDTDTDGDGISDDSELSNDTDPLDALSFPNAGYLAYIRDDGSARTLEYGALSGLDAPTVLTSEDAESAPEPHQPRFIGDKSLIMTLSGAPESTSTVDVFNLYADEPGLPTQIDTGVTLRSASIFNTTFLGNNPPIITAIHADPDQPGDWLLSSISSDDQTLTKRETTLPEMRNLYSNGRGYATFLGGPRDCLECLTGYRIRGDSNQIITLNAQDGFDDWQDIRINASNRFSAIFPAQDGGGQVGYYENNVFRPPGTTQINSFFATGNGHNVVVSARRNDTSPYELWFYNSRAKKWYPLLSAPEDLIEIDWVIETPDNTPTPVDPNLPVE